MHKKKQIMNLPLLKLASQKRNLCKTHLLVHELQDKGGVGWNVEKLYDLELLKDIIFEVRWVSRRIVQDKKGLQG